MDEVRDKLVMLLERDDCPLLYVLGEDVGSLADYLIANGVTIQRWIPVTERLPENEEDVLVLVERRIYGIKEPGSKISAFVAMAFHTDGETTTEDSNYTWELWDTNADYDEEADAYIVPEGWWERVLYGEEFSAVDDFVTHWMPLPDAPKEVE